MSTTHLHFDTEWPIKVFSSFFLSPTHRQLTAQGPHLVDRGARSIRYQQHSDTGTRHGHIYTYSYTNAQCITVHTHNELACICIHA